jgi:hypothetical protein
MDTKNRNTAATAAVIVAIVAVIFIGLLNGGFGTGGGTPTAGGNPPGDKCAPTTVASQYAADELRLDDGQYKIDKIDKSLPGATSNRGGSHSERPLLSEQELRQYLASGSPQALSYRQQLGDMKDVSWVSIQSLVPMHYDEATIWVNGKTAIVNDVDVPKGDVIWVPVLDCKVVGTPIRAACGNPIVPNHPPTCKGSSCKPHPRCTTNCTTPTPTPTPCESQTATTCPKDANAIPDQPSTPASAKPSPIGTVGNPTRPASPDPTTTNGLPVHDVNPPTESAVPDSGSGAGGATANAPSMSQTPEPAPSATNTVIVESD